MKAKNMILVDNNKSIAFNVQRRKNKAIIDYFTDSELDYQIECELDRANKFYETAMKEGYSEAF
jgi:hypothetical protein